jgi:hypothetical protein
LEWPFIGCLVFSIAIEVPVLGAYVRWRFRGQSPPWPSWPRIIATGALATTTSLPYLWFLVPTLVHTSLFWWIGEGMVIAIETAIIGFVLPLPAKDALAASTLCNLSSLALGSAALAVLV